MLRKRTKFGFTLVEVVLFLALSSSIMLGVILATNASVSRQRYNDSVNDFADFLRGIYSSVIDVQHSDFTANDSGKSGTAIYGKLITFRETGNNTDTIYVYDVVGKVVSVADSATLGTNVLGMLTNDKVNATIADSENNIYGRTSHIIPWQAHLERPNTDDGSGVPTTYNCDESYTDGCFVGAVLIVRSPVSGSVYTYVSTNPFEFDPADAKNALKNYLTKSTPNIADIDFCLDSDDNHYPNRRNIRIVENGINSTAVEMVEMDTEDGGSQCFGRS